MAVMKVDSTCSTLGGAPDVHRRLHIHLLGLRALLRNVQMPPEREAMLRYLKRGYISTHLAQHLFKAQGAAQYDISAAKRTSHAKAQQCCSARFRALWAAWAAANCEPIHPPSQRTVP